MPVKDGYLQWILEQLSGAGRISTRRMFGAVGLYRGDVFFAIISNDVLYFKVSDVNRADYESRGARQFRPFRDKPHLSMSYFEVPPDILEDADECATWAQRAVAAALATQAGPRRKSAAKRVRRPRQ
jgi:DNA transformation protein